MEQPLVSVPVITYNSAKTVLETLESIKAQTYRNIELIVSDDCSTDNTVELCRDWIEQNKSRFVRTELLTAEKNTGISANMNRAEATCQGEWVKPIAGDDLLIQSCIQLCIQYIQEKKNVVCLFGRQKSFGTDESTCEEYDAYFDYSLFEKSREEQLHYLIYNGCFVSTTTAFYNHKIINDLNIHADERIPFLEDLPRWIRLLQSGVDFDFVNSVLVMYRMGGISKNDFPSFNFYKSQRLTRFYYQYPEWVKMDFKTAVERIVDEECTMYASLLKTINDLQVIKHSKAYRFGRFLMAPIHWLKNKRK